MTDIAHTPDTYTSAEQHALAIIGACAYETSQVLVEGPDASGNNAAMTQTAGRVQLVLDEHGMEGLVCLVTALGRHAGYGYAALAEQRDTTVPELVEEMATRALHESQQ